MSDIRTYDNVPISYDVLQEEMVQYNSPKDKISKLAQKGSLIRLKRGLYTIPRAISGQNISNELIANHLYGPSYVSFESALSIHGLIPERVYTFKSATLKRRKEYDTPLGVFQYIHVPGEYYPIGLNFEIVNNSFAYMIAGPEKALCDQIICTAGLRLQSLKSVGEYLFEDLRIDEDRIFDLNPEIIQECSVYGYKRTDLNKVAKFIHKIIQNR